MIHFTPTKKPNQLKVEIIIDSKQILEGNTWPFYLVVTDFEVELTSHMMVNSARNTRYAWRK